MTKTPTLPITPNHTNRLVTTPSITHDQENTIFSETSDCIKYCTKSIINLKESEDMNKNKHIANADLLKDNQLNNFAQCMLLEYLSYFRKINTNDLHWFLIFTLHSDCAQSLKF